MKVATVICLLAILAGCSNALSPSEPRDQTLAIGFGQTMTVPGTSLKIAFTDVTDSRCPASVVCVWEGDAAVRLESNGESVVLHSSPAAGPQKAKLATVTVTLLDVKPPRLTTEQPRKSDYMATIRVSR